LGSLITLSNSNQEFEAEFSQLELGLFIAGRNAAVIMKTQLLPFPKPTAKPPSDDERNVLTAHHRATQGEQPGAAELAATRAERDALERALRRNQKREPCMTRN
jgi:hypothetical protein